MESTSKMTVSWKAVIKTYWESARHFKLHIFTLFLGLSMGLVGDITAPIFYKKFFDILESAMPSEASVSELFVILLSIVGLKLFSRVGHQVGAFANAVFQLSVMKDLRIRAFEYLMGHSYGFFINNFTGALVQRVNRIARAFEIFADRISWDLFPLILRIIGAVTVLWFLEPILSVSMIVFILVFVAVNYGITKYKLKFDIEAAKLDSEATGIIADSISNSTTVKIFTGRENESRLYRKVSENIYKLTLFRWRLGEAVDSIQGFLFIAIEFLLFYLALRYWERGVFTIGTFVLIQAYILMIVNRLWDFSRILRNLYESFADAKEMVEIMNMPYDVKDSQNARKFHVTRGEIVFENVYFRYHHDKPVLRGLNLHIKHGQKVGLVGPSGAGKSTVVHLLFRFYDVEDGRVFIDSVDVQRITQESLRSQIALVPQDPVLFHRSIMENIRYGRRGASDADVYSVAKLANCHEFIEQLPQKYDTLVGERGVKLSGGERQRVAMARAMLKDAPILVLDEATSSLDSRSEMLIQDALDKLMRGRTTIVIAHRLSTIRKMDRIIVLQRGRVLEAGSHEELLRKNKSLYKKLWNLQAGGFLQEIEG